MFVHSCRERIGKAHTKEKSIVVQNLYPKKDAKISGDAMLCYSVPCRVVPRVYLPVHRYRVHVW